MKPAREGPTGGRPRRQWAPALRFAATFVVLLALYAATYRTAPVQRWVHAPASHLVALSCLPVLSLLGEASRSGTLLQFEGFHAEVVDACNGILPGWIYVAAVVAFPSRWSQKLRGFLIGLPALFAINVVRVISLMLLGARAPDLVERIHIDVWQTAVVVLSMALWTFWAERIVGRQPAFGP
jgi:exosortase/archaeosortase family protein